MKRPPAWADRFLEWYCRPDLLEEIQGDLHELYSDRQTTAGAAFAGLRYVWDVFRFLRLSNIRSINTQKHNTMTFSYFKTGWRQLRAQRSTSVINIFGLALAIGFAITVYMFQDHFLHMDRFHEQGENIYQVLNHVEGDDHSELWSDIPYPVLPSLEDASAVRFATYIEFGEANIRHSKDVFREFIWYVSPDYMRMFDFPLLYGDRDALNRKSEIIITADMAMKYFGKKDVVGEVLHMKLDDGTRRSLTIGAVLEELPDRASFGGQFLISIENYFEGMQDPDYTILADAIFIQLSEGATPGDLEGVLDPMINLQNQSSERWKTLRFEAMPLFELSLRHMEIKSSVAGGAHPSGRIAMSVIAIMLLLLACFNYVNIAVASATRRLKEIALRKVMGGVRGQIIRQFLTENLLICLIATCAGLMISYYILLPGFNASLPITIPFQFSSIFSAVIFFAGLVAIVTFASGAYPAFYISRFRPVTIFRGKEKFGARQVFTKILMVIQLLIAFSTIVACFVFNDNAIHLAQRHWGYEPANVLAVPVHSRQQAEVMKAEIAGWSNIDGVDNAYGHIGDFNRLTQVEKGEFTVNAYIYETGADYNDIMGLKLTEGRWYDDNEGSRSIIISELMAKRLNLADPLTETIVYDSISYNIIGVVADFYPQIFYLENLPSLFIPASRERINYIVVKAASGSADHVNDKLMELWHTVAPDDPYEGFHQEVVMDEFFTENRANIKVLSVISLFALILACFGLYGLVSFQVSGRMREISVRRVLGANLAHLTRVINRDYFWMLGIAMVIGLPLGYMLISQLIKNIYPDPEPATVWPFMLSIMVLGISIALTLGSQLVRVSRANPVDILRTD